MTTDTLQTVELAYSDDLAEMGEQYRSGRAFGSGVSLTLAIAAMRSGLVYFGKNRTGDGEGWKGIDSTLRIPAMKDVSKGDLSKATKVVTHFIPDSLTCDVEDVVSHVLAFVNLHGSIDAAYAKWNAEDKGREPRAWSLEDAIQTVLRKAVKEGIDGDTVSETFTAALAKHYPTD